MTIALDTNAYSAEARAEPKAVALLHAANQITLPFVVLAEPRAGFAAGTAGRRNEALARFLGSPRVDVLYADEQTTHHYASAYAQLRRQGTPIPIWCCSPKARTSRRSRRSRGREPDAPPPRARANGGRSRGCRRGQRYHAAHANPHVHSSPCSLYERRAQLWRRIDHDRRRGHRFQGWRYFYGGCRSNRRRMPDPARRQLGSLRRRVAKRGR